MDASAKLQQEGCRLTLIAEQPAVVTPTGIDVDESGAVWVVSSHTHFRPKEYQGPTHDEVVVLTPSGKSMDRRVFYNQTTSTMDLELGEDGWVYLAERSRVLRVRDTDGDGVGDQQELIAKLTTEATYPHNGISGLCWHPNGDLVFALGENYADDWELTSGATDHSIRGSGEGGIFRCQANGANLRRIARGFWNPFGICIREDGEMFAAENDPGARPPCRLLHVVEGGDYGYQRRYGAAAFHPFVAWNGEVRGTLPMLTAVGEAPCGIAPLAGGLLVGSWTEHRIDYYPLKSKGASYSSDRVTLATGGNDFRPTCMAAGKPGVYYFADWVKGSYQLHGHGRVWKLEVDPDAPWLAPLAPMSPAASAARSLVRAKTDNLPSFDDLLRQANSEDPFAAQAAVAAMAWRRQDEVGARLSKSAFEKLSEQDRLTMIQAVRANLDAFGDNRLDKQLLTESQRDEWITLLLNDPSRAVRVDALHWIADERLQQFSDQVTSQMSDPQFELFEASLAAANSLSGDAKKGLGDAPLLLAIVRDESKATTLRTFALRLIDPAAKQLELADLKQWLSAGEPLRSEVVRTLAGNPTAANRKLLHGILETSLREKSAVKNRALVMDAMLGLAAAPDEHWDVLAQFVLHSDRQISAEALRAIRHAKHANKTRLLRSLESTTKDHAADLIRAAMEPDSLAKGRPSLADTNEWMRRLDAAPGGADPEAGRRVFFNRSLSNCLNCHRHSGRGNVVGPDLSAIGNRADATALLRDILEPSRDVAPQYRPRQLMTDDGEVFIGLLLRDGGGGREYYRNALGREQAFETAKIVRRKEIATSMMPDKLPLQLTYGELRDLLAFLMASNGDRRNSDTLGAKRP